MNVTAAIEVDLLILLLGWAISLLIAYMVVKYGVLHALRQHAKEQGSRYVPPASPAQSPTPTASGPRPAGYKGSQSLNFPDGQP